MNDARANANHSSTGLHILKGAAIPKSPSPLIWKGHRQLPGRGAHDPGRGWGGLRRRREERDRGGTVGKAQRQRHGGHWLEQKSRRKTPGGECRRAVTARQKALKARLKFNCFLSIVAKKILDLGSDWIKTDRGLC